MTSSLQHHGEGEIPEFENTLELEQMDRDVAPHSSLESASARTNKNKQTNMSENISRETQDSRSNYDNERRSSSSEIPQIVVEESSQLHEEQNNKRDVQMTFVSTFGDSADLSILVADVSNGSSSTDSSVTWTETTDLETSSVISHGDSSSSQSDLERHPQTSINLSSSESPLPRPGPSTSYENSSSSSLNDSPPPSSSINASLASTSTITTDRPQMVDRVLPSQLLDPRAAGVSYASKLSPLMYIPPPPYTEQPPSYNAIEHSLATAADLQRGAPLTLEMPPSYDAAVDVDLTCVVRDLRRRPTENTSRRSSGCSISCCAWYFALIVVVLLVFVIFKNV